MKTIISLKLHRLQLPINCQLKYKSSSTKHIFIFHVYYLIIINNNNIDINNKNNDIIIIIIIVIIIIIIIIIIKILVYWQFHEVALTSPCLY